MTVEGWVPVIAAAPETVGPPGPPGPQGPPSGEKGDKGDPAKAWVGDVPPPPESSFVLWVDTSDESAVPGSPSLVIKGIGNLLTENQAKPTTTGGYTVTNATEGTAGVFTATGSSAVSAYLTAANGIPVTAGDTYTLLATVACTGGRTSRVRIRWVNGGGSDVSNDYGDYLASGTSRVTAVAPAGAAKAMVYAVSSTAGAASDTVTLTAASFHRGSGGTWQLPGVPVPGQGAIKANGAVELPGGDFSPEGVVTANPGSTFLQTSGAATATGTLLWRKATGTGTNTGWVAEGALADTGWRDIAATDPGNGWAVVASAFKLRRIGSTVYINGRIDGTSATQDYTSTGYIPDGFRPFEDTFWAVPVGTAGAARTARIGSTGAITVFTRFAGVNYINTVIATKNSWPSSLPGAAA